MVAELEKPEVLASVASFVINSSVLLRHVKMLKAVVSNNPIVPILENILFVFAGDTLTLTASDLHNTITCTLPVNPKDNQVNLPCSFCVYATRLYKLLSSLPEQELTINFNGQSKVTVIAQTGSYNFHSERPEDFPKLPTVTDAETFTISGKDLAAGLAHTYPFTSTDDLRPAMTGINVIGNELASTDGHRLIRWRLERNLSDGSFIIARKGADLFLKAFGKSDDSVNVKKSAATILFNWANITLISRLIDERFPDYRNAIPTENNSSAVINRKALIATLSRAKVFSNQHTTQLVLTFTAHSLTVQSNSDYLEDCTETLSIQSEMEFPIKAGFNATLLIEVLKSISASHVQFKMANGKRACLIYPHDEGEPNLNHLSLVMPVMLNEY